MTSTDRLGLPEIAADQALKHVTHNEALLALDGLVQASVLDAGTTAPPASPAPGDAHIVGAAATGAWAGQDNAVAAWSAAGWRFFPPGTGWRVWDAANSVLLVWSGSAWVDLFTTATTLQNMALLGVNATADATNKFAVRSNAVLFNALEAGSGGTGDMRLTMNAETVTDTATLVFQSGWSARAEFGLAASEDFSIKVSADGSTFFPVLSADRTTGNLTVEKLLSAKPDFPTVAAGVLAVVSSYAIPAPESGAADDIDTINGGADGALLILSGTASVTLTVKDGTGNLLLGADRVLDSAADTLLLVRRGSNWLELGSANNG
jgi:uncharacterized protein DUF2793